MKTFWLIMLLALATWNAPRAEEVAVLLGGVSYDDLVFTFFDAEGEGARAEIETAAVLGFTGRAPLGAGPFLFAGGADLAWRTAHLTAVGYDGRVRLRLESDFILCNLFAGLGLEHRTGRLRLGLDAGLLLCAAWHEGRSLTGTRTTADDSAFGPGTRLQAGLAFKLPEGVWLGLMGRLDTLRLDFDHTSGHDTVQARALLLTCLVEW